MIFIYFHAFFFFLLPFMMERKKTSFFNNIKLRIISKIFNWQSQMFSRGGKKYSFKIMSLVFQDAFGVM